MDKIKITGLEVFAHHGVLPEETKRGQIFLVSAALYVDFTRAVAADDLAQTVDYAAVCRDISAFLKENTFKLIETAAGRLAEFLLKKYKYTLQKIQIEIEKPAAPVGLPLKAVAAETERGWHTAYIAAGSNLGDRQKFLDDAAESFIFMDDCILMKASKAVETKPYGGVKQPDFLNGCMEIKTILSPHKLLERLRGLEEAAGRIREVPKGPRTLDLDILLYDDLVLDTKDLTVPHPDMENRKFVLGPLTEIAPEALHPALNKTARELLTVLTKKLS